MQEKIKSMNEANGFHTCKTFVSNVGISIFERRNIYFLTFEH